MDSSDTKKSTQSYLAPLPTWAEFERSQQNESAADAKNSASCPSWLRQLSGAPRTVLVVLLGLVLVLIVAGLWLASMRKKSGKGNNSNGANHGERRAGYSLPIDHDPFVTALPVMGKKGSVANGSTVMEDELVPLEMPVRDELQKLRNTIKFAMSCIQQQEQRLQTVESSLTEQASVTLSPRPQTYYTSPNGPVKATNRTLAPPAPAPASGPAAPTVTSYNQPWQQNSEAPCADNEETEPADGGNGTTMGVGPQQWQQPVTLRSNPKTTNNRRVSPNNDGSFRTNTKNQRSQVVHGNEPQPQSQQAPQELLPDDTYPNMPQPQDQAQDPDQPPMQSQTQPQQMPQQQQQQQWQQKPAAPGRNANPRQTPWVNRLNSGPTLGQQRPQLQAQVQTQGQSQRRARR